MFEELALSAFCLLATVIGLAVSVWEVISGRIFDMDGLWLTLISLTLAAVFGGTLAWSFYIGEGRQVLRRLRKGSTSEDGREKGTPTST